MAALSGKDSKILNLINALGLPKRCKKFKIEGAYDDILTVTCEYYQELDLDENGELITLLKKYKLEEIEESDTQIRLGEII